MEWLAVLWFVLLFGALTAAAYLIWEWIHGRP